MGRSIRGRIRYQQYVSRSIKDTPARLLFGINQKIKIEDGLKRFLELDNSDRDLETTRRNASTNIRKLQTYNAKCYNEKRKIPREFIQDDLVMITNNDVTPGMNKKLAPRF
ncbi:hypothetical protein Trydic_g5508 [Trypoxylus dichotomus]